MGIQCKGLTAKELIFGVFRSIVEHYNAEKKQFQYRPSAEIRSVDDHMSTREGYMYYHDVYVALIVGKEWIIAFGEKGGGWVTEKIGNDLLIKKIGSTPKTKADIFFEKLTNKQSEELPELTLKQIIEKEIENNCDYFKNSVLSSFDDGSLLFPKHSCAIQKKIRDFLINSKSEELIVRKPEYDREYVLPDLSEPKGFRPIVTQCILYQSSLVKKIADIIIEQINKDGT